MYHFHIVFGILYYLSMQFNTEFLNRKLIRIYFIQPILDITLLCVTLYYVRLHYVTLRYIALHCVTLRYIALHCVTLRYIALHYVITLHYVALRCITFTLRLHYVALRLHYITCGLEFNMHFPLQENIYFSCGKSWKLFTI